MLFLQLPVDFIFTASGCFILTASSCIIFTSSSCFYFPASGCFYSTSSTISNYSTRGRPHQQGRQAGRPFTTLFIIRLFKQTTRVTPEMPFSSTRNTRFMFKCSQMFLLAYESDNSQVQLFSETSSLIDDSQDLTYEPSDTQPSTDLDASQSRRLHDMVNYRKCIVFRASLTC